MDPTRESLIEDVRRELNLIVDPCSRTAGAPAGLVDMGLVREIVIEGDPDNWSVRVSLSVTHPFCMMGGVFLNDAEKRLRAMRKWSSIEVTQDCKMLWSPDLMTPEYAARLQSARKHREIAP